MKKFVVLLLLSSCQPSCFINREDMHACAAMCGSQGAGRFDREGCHCRSDLTVQVETRDGGACSNAEPARVQGIPPSPL